MVIYSKIHVCPRCHKENHLKPHIGAEEYYKQGVGVCIDTKACGYSFTKENYLQNLRRQSIEYIPESTVKKTMGHYHENNFVIWLNMKFDPSLTHKAIDFYKIGTAKNGGTIFWVQNEFGKYVEGIKINYCPSKGLPINKHSFLSEKIIPEKENRPARCFLGTQWIKNTKEKIYVLPTIHQTIVASMIFSDLFLSSFTLIPEIQRRKYPFVKKWFDKMEAVDKYFLDDSQSPFNLP